jgi:hypothetical protein
MTNEGRDGMISCASCSKQWPPSVNYCGACGSRIPTAPQVTFGQSIHQFRKFLSAVPGITLGQDIIEGLSGMSDVNDLINKEPANPYGYFRFALTLDSMAKTRNSYRVFRVMLHGPIALAGIAFGNVLKRLDSEATDPKEAALTMAASLSAGRLASAENKGHAELLLAASAYHLYQAKHDPAWKAVATKAFTYAALRAREPHLAADALIGLMLLAEADGRLDAARSFRNSSSALGSRSSALGYPPGSSPSIWDIGKYIAPATSRVAGTAAYTVRRQIERTSEIARKGIDYAAKINKQ